MIIPVSKSRVYESIYSQMIKFIECGIWKEKEAIPGEIELAAQFNVSRNSLRTAIKVLHSSEILESKPGIGTFVTENALMKIKQNELMNMIQDTQNIEEIFQVRQILDKEIASIAAVKRTEEDLKHLRKCIDNLEKSTKEENVEDIIHWGSEFHMKMVNITNNKVLINMYTSLRAILDADRLRYLKSNGIKEVYIDYILNDRKIIEAIEQGDVDKVKELLSIHIEMRKKRK